MLIEHCRIANIVGILHKVYSKNKKNKTLVAYLLLLTLSAFLIGCSSTNQKELTSNQESDVIAMNETRESSTVGNYNIDIESAVEGHPSGDAIFQTSDTWKDTDTTDTEINVEFYFYDYSIKEDVSDIFQYDSFDTCDTISTYNDVVYYRIDDKGSSPEVHFYFIQDENSYMRVDACVICRFDEAGSFIDTDVDLQDYVDQMSLWDSLKITVKRL